MSGDRRPPLLLTTLILITTITALISSLGAPLVPAIAVAHGVSLQDAQWTLTGAIIVGAVATPLLGRLGGGRRRRPVVLACLAIVCAGTLLAALPLGFAALLAGRLAQGVGLGLAPLAIAAARDALPADRLAAPLSVLSVAVVAGAGLGYPVTGLIADRAGIAGAFWVGFALSLATLALAVLRFPAATTEHDGRVDWVGAPLLALGTSGVLLALTQGPVRGWLAWQALGLGLLGVALLALWVRRTLRSPHPLVDLRLLRHRGLIAINLTALAGGLGMYLMLTLVVVVVQEPAASGWGLGRSVTVAGLMLVPYSLFSVLGSRVALALGRRHDPQIVLPLGCGLYVASALAMMAFHDTVWQLALVMVIGGLGSGCTFSVMPGLVVREVPAHETGSAMAFNQVLRYLGFSLGITVGVTLLGAFDAGRPTEAGLVAALAAAAGVLAVAAVGNVALARR